MNNGRLNASVSGNLLRQEELKNETGMAQITISLQWTNKN
jgi:hypothetical protein